jgi:antitoxin (DNA-binding transcriptional repressor) of toxin-antitoxin stability system
MPETRGHVRLTDPPCLTTMSDMARFQVKNRDFQRALGEWMARARQGDTVVIVSAQGPPLTLTAGAPRRDAMPDWTRHFEWLQRQPVHESNPVDDLRSTERR